MRARHRDRGVAPLTVLMHPPAADQDNPYVRMLTDALELRDIRVRPFRWRLLLVGRYDILHVHWPEALVRDGRRTMRLVKSALLGISTVRNRLRGAKHVQTIHNVRPHERGGALERASLLGWKRTLDGAVLMNRAPVAVPARTRVAVIPHGDYQPYIDAHLSSPRPPRASEPGTPPRVLFFGRLRPYKDIEKLIAASGSADYRVTIAGEPLDESYAERLRSLVPASSDLELRLGPLADAELLAEIERSDVVCLPYREVYNSGAVLLALTANRPVVTTDSPSMRELQAETTSRWLALLPDGWTDGDLEHEVSGLWMQHRGGTRAERPLAASREWRHVAALHEFFYRGILTRPAERAARRRAARAETAPARSS